MTLKVLTQKDINLITDLYSEDFSDGWNSEMLLSAFKEGRFNAVGCFSEEDLVGVITYTKGLDDVIICTQIQPDFEEVRPNHFVACHHLLEQVEK